MTKSVLAFAAFCGLSLAISSALAQSIHHAETYYSMKLGDDVVVALSDGSAIRPLLEILPGATDDGAASRSVTLPINAFLIKAGPRLVLVDTGAGTLLGPQVGGQLLKSLRDAGYQPEQIDAVLLTHAHPDHIGGLSAAGAPMFPNATLYIDRREILDAQGDASDSPRLKALRRFQTLMIEPYRSAGRLRTFDGPTQLFAGVRSIPAYGHSQGHSAFMIESKGRRLLLWGDVIHVASEQFGALALTAATDADPQLAIETRARLMSLAASKRLLVGGAHLTFPGLGEVRAAKGSYTWKPVPVN